MMSRADNASAETIGRYVQNWGMAGETIASSAYTKLLHARMREAREARSFSQKDMARLLGVTQDAYEKYETRSRLPHHLLEPFALATGVSLSTLIAGREVRAQPRPVQPAPAAPAPKKPAAKKGRG